jgi:isoleucyl-tRNA synthetase
LVNRIQNIRKDSGFEVTDKIKVHLQKNSDPSQSEQAKQLEKAVKANEAYIKSETLTETLLFEDSIIDGIEIEFDEIKTKIAITK